MLFVQNESATFSPKHFSVVGVLLFEGSNRGNTAWIREPVPNQSQTSQTCSQSSDTMFHCFSAQDSFLDDCIRLRPSNSIFQRVIFWISVYLQPPAAQNRGVWMCFWGVCNGSQQNPFTGSVCGTAYVQNVQNVSEEKIKNLTARTLFCFPWRSEQVLCCGGVRNGGWLRVKGSLSAGRISWMFWEAVMKTRGG